jgi:hypothetical protein
MACKVCAQGFCGACLKAAYPAASLKIVRISLTNQLGSTGIKAAKNARPVRFHDSTCTIPCKIPASTYITALFLMRIKKPVPNAGIVWIWNRRLRFLGLNRLIKPYKAAV